MAKEFCVATSLLVVWGCSAPGGALAEREVVSEQRQASTFASRGWHAGSVGTFEATQGPVGVLVDAGEVRLADAGTSPKAAGSVGIKLTGLERGGSALSLSDGTPTLQGAKLLIERGPLREELALGGSSLTDTLVIPSKPAGTGVLKARFQVDGDALTTLAATHVISFALGDKQLRVSGSSAIAGYHRGEISLEIDQYAVESGDYPQTLKLTLTPTFDFFDPEQTPGERVIPNRSTANLACRVDQCLAAWTMDESAVAMRLNPDGTAVDSRFLQLGYLGTNARVSASPNGEYLAVSGRGLATFVDPGTGRVSDDPPFQLTDGQVEAVAFAGGVHLLVAHDAGGQRSALRVQPAAVQPLAQVTTLAPTNDQRGVALAAGDVQFAVVDGNKLQRIDAATGNLLDATPLTFSKYGYGAFASKPSVIFDGENYIVVWVDSGNLYASRVRASDGQLLDADNDQGSTIGARKLCVVNRPAQTSLQVDDGTLYVTWLEDQTLRATSFALGSWTSSNAACDAASVIDDDDGLDALAFSGPHGLTLTSSTVAAVTRLRRLAFDVTTPTSVQLKLDELTGSDPVWTPGKPRFVSNGRDFLVVANAFGPPTLALSLIDGATGKRRWQRLLEPGIIEQFTPAAAAGSDFLLNYQNYVRKISCAGTVGTQHQLEGVERSKGLLSDGTSFLGVFDGDEGSVSEPPQFPRYGVRLDGEGNVLGARIDLSTADAGRFSGAVATTGVAPNFWLLGGIDSNVLGLDLAQVDGASGAVSSTPLSDDADARSWSLAGDGANLLLIGESNGKHVGIVRNAAGATVVSEKEIPLTPPRATGPTFDGVSYVECDRYDHIVRLSPTLELLDTSSLSGSDTYDPEQSACGAAHASSAYGRTLFGESAGFFYDNDQAVDDPNGAPDSNCPSDPEGGAGGAGGTSASAGTSTGGTSTGGTSTGGAGTSTGGTSTGGTNAGGAGTSSGGASSGGTNAGGAGTSNGGGISGSGNSGGGDSAGTQNMGAAAGTVNAGGTDAGAAAGGSSDGDGGDGSTATAGSGGKKSGSTDSDGCSCKAAGGSPPPSWPAAALAALVLLRRRRR